jgi:hypothetical protein
MGKFAAKACRLAAGLLWLGAAAARADAPAASPQDAGYQQAVQSQIETVVDQTLDDFFAKAGQPKPEKIEVRTHADFDGKSSQPEIRRLKIDVGLATDAPPAVVREARAAVQRALAGNGYRFIAADDAEDQRPLATLNFDVAAPGARAGENHPREYAVFATLVVLSLVGFALLARLLTLPLRRAKKRKARRAARRQPGAEPVGVQAREPAPFAPAAPEPALDLPPPPTLAESLQARPAPRPRAEALLPQRPPATEPPPPSPPAAAPRPTATTKPRPSPAAAAALSRRIARAIDASRRPRAELEGGVPTTMADLYEPTASAGGAPPSNSTPVLNGPADLAGLQGASRETVRRAFDHLPFEKAVDLLAGVDTATRRAVIDKLQLRAPLRERLERELAALPPRGPRG